VITFRTLTYLKTVGSAGVVRWFEWLEGILNPLFLAKQPVKTHSLRPTSCIGAFVSADWQDARDSSDCKMIRRSRNRLALWTIPEQKIMTRYRLTPMQV